MNRLTHHLRRTRRVDHTGEVQQGIRAMPTWKYNSARRRSYRAGFFLGILCGAVLGFFGSLVFLQAVVPFVGSLFF